MLRDMTTPIHTIFGAGQVGTKLAHLLLRKGHAVRLVRRGPATFEHPRLTWMRGDMTDAGFARAAAAGADVVYNCTNPPAYHGWDRHLPPLYRGAIDAAARAGARLVVLENVYMYGAPTGAPFTEDSPLAPASAMGEIRARLTGELFDAHRRGDVRATAGLAPDFFGPATPNAAVFHQRFVDRLRAGKAVELLGDPTLPHSYGFTPDVAVGLAVLGARDDALGRHWHLPVAHQGSTIDLVEHLARAAGVAPRWKVLPRWLLRSLGLVSPTLRSVTTMLYQWEAPFVVDDTRFRQQFAVAPTAVTAAARATLAPAPETVALSAA